MRSENIVKVVALNEDGRSVRYIANLLNIAKSTVHDALAR
jgi:IS30 family transposase